MENVLDGSIEGKESRLRTAFLAQMLSESNPRDLFAPTCLGFVDDRKQNRDVDSVLMLINCLRLQAADVSRLLCKIYNHTRRAFYCPSRLMLSAALLSKRSTT